MYLLQSFWNYTDLFCRIWVLSLIYLFFFPILNDSIKMLIVKYIYFYSFNSIVPKKKTEFFNIVWTLRLMLGLLVAQFLNFLGFFLNFRKNDIICNNCKMHLLLQFSFNRFKIIQGFSMGYQHYHLCLVWRSMSVKIFGIFFRRLFFDTFNHISGTYMGQEP